MINRVLVAVVLMGMLFPQVFPPQESEVKISNIKTTTGIGFEVPTLDMYISLFGENSQTSSGSIYLPMVTEKFMIEPNISYMYSSNEVDIENSDYDDQEDYESSLMVNVGLFFVNYKSEKLRTYTGARVGMATSKSKEPSEDETKGKAFLFGPAMGAEYFISEHLSFGGEFTLRITRSEEEDSDNYYGEYTETETTTLLVPTLMVRFYF
jgi:hypothetical protein